MGAEIRFCTHFLFIYYLNLATFEGEGKLFSQIKYFWVLFNVDECGKQNDRNVFKRDW